MSNVRITKSEYTAGVQCPKRLYLLSHHSELATAPGDDLQLRFKQGQQVGEIARSRFPGGVMISATGSAIQNALQTTASHLLELKVPAIFEAAVSFESLLVRVDILKNNFDGTWDIVEVKSTTELKEEHLDDVGFQLYVLRNAGVKVRNVYLSHINNEVRFPNLDDLFTDNDLTQAAEAHLPVVEEKVRHFLRIIQEPTPPAQQIGRQCANPYGCEFKDQCWADVPKGSVLELYNYRKRKPTKFELYHKGPKMISDLTNQVELTRFQEIQRLAAHSDKPIVDPNGLHEFLEQVRFPIYYFDFETIAPPIPVLNGMRPYQRIPVQFSCHVQRAQGAELEHYEFLASGKPGVDPRRECIESMKRIFTAPGSIVAYHDDFERSLIRELAEAFPEDREYLLALESTFWDLEDAFHHFFYHKDFGGSVSIKKVLPFFAPEMKYDKLAIKNGGQAQAALFRLLSSDLSEADRQKLRENLLTYCAQDSMAMVVIHQKLGEVVGGNLRFLDSKRVKIAQA